MTIMAFAFLAIAIVTKDPLFSKFGVPIEFEWVIGLFLTGFTSWKIYFNPLKERVIKTESETAVIKTDVASIKSDVILIKNKLLK